MKRSWLSICDHKGSVFLATMVCAFVMSLVGGYTYKMSTYNSSYINRLQKSMQAQQLAEAGLMRALSTIRTSWSSINTASNFPATNLGNGSYDASITTSGGRYLVSSVGTVGSVTRTVTAEVTAPSTSALNYMFAAGGNIEMDSGTGQSPGTVTGNIYAAGNAQLDGPSSGGQLVITGSVYANGNVTSNSSVSISGSSNAHWATTESFPVVTYSYYQTIAQANGQYTNGNVTYASGGIPANPAGGVIYVNGNVTIRGTQSTTACIVATGNITIEKQGSTYPRVTVNQYSNYPAMLVQGNIQFSSNGNGGAYWNATGLVYAGGNIEVSSGNHDTFGFTGSVIARGNIQTTGLTAWNTLTGTYVAQSPPSVSGGGGSSTATIKSYNL